MTETKNTKTSKKKNEIGTGRMYSLPSGAVSFTTDQIVGKLITLPTKERLEAVWNPNTEELTFRRWRKT